MTTHDGGRLRKECLDDRDAYYGWGDEGQTRKGKEYMDCSGAVYDNFREAGFPIGRDTAAGLYRTCTAVKGTPKIGDLGFFDFNGTGIDHVVICIGNGQTFEARSAHLTPNCQVHTVAWQEGRGGFKGWRRYPNANWAFPKPPVAPAPMFNGRCDIDVKRTAVYDKPNGKVIGYLYRGHFGGYTANEHGMLHVWWHAGKADAITGWIHAGDARLTPGN
jgi:hypothetical protein